MRLANVRARIQHGVDEGGFPADTSVNGMSPFVVSVVKGMSLHARDGATAADLRELATVRLRGLTAD